MEIGIVIELMHMRPAGQTFDAGLFYQVRKRYYATYV